MTEVVVIQASSTSSIHDSPTRNDRLLYQQQHSLVINSTSTPPTNISPPVTTSNTNTEEGEEGGGERKRRREEKGDQGEEQLNLVGLVFTVFRRSVFGCSSSCDHSQGRLSISGASCSSGGGGGGGSGGGVGGIMEIGWPTNVRHVAHVTFDRFNGFLGLPVEFEPEVPRRAPSASTRVFGVSTNSMQLSFDTRGNSVPTILLLMQHRLYSLGGLQAEGIFRINADNGQEEFVRDQLNRGLIPDDVDVHCLAGLIKAWFRELPTGVLDCLSPEQVMQSQTEEECSHLARLLPPTEAALLDWAINLMADVAQFEHLNKMNARNIAMVFAPNMTHMADPLTALMHAVQVMNFLKTLIEKTLREREDSILDSVLDSSSRDPSGGNGHHNSLQTILEEANEQPSDQEEERDSKYVNPSTEDESSLKSVVPGENLSSISNYEEDESTADVDNSLIAEGKENKSASEKSQGAKASTTKKVSRKICARPKVHVAKPAAKVKGTSLVSSVNPRTERIEAWR